VTTSNVCQSHWLHILRIVLVERPDRLDVHRVYFNRPCVYL
jgi:hypothetical protein